MIGIARRRVSRPPPESDLSQVLAHGPAYREAYGKYLGAFLMLVAISRRRRGAAGITAGLVMITFFIYKLYS
jgi:hypothetical protein